MENQVTRSLTAIKVIEDFKAKKEINLSEGDAEKSIDLIYFFSEQVFKLYKASKTCNPIKFNSSQTETQRIFSETDPAKTNSSAGWLFTRTIS